MKGKALFLFLNLFIFLSAQDTLRVYFDTDSFQVDVKAQSEIVEFCDSIEEVFKLFAYCDERGSNSYNLNLAQKRAQSVAAYLTQNCNAKETSIFPVGEIESSEEMYPHYRRVDIIRNIPNLKTENTTPSAPSPSLFNDTQIGKAVIFNNLHFYPGRHQMYPYSLEQLDLILQDLKEHPNIHLSIEGHICCDSDNGYPDGFDFDTGKYNLSVARAQYVHDYLIENGIEAHRLSYKGLSRNFPLGRSDLEDRRVEFIVTKK